MTYHFICTWHWELETPVDLRETYLVQNSLYFFYKCDNLQLILWFVMLSVASSNLVSGEHKILEIQKDLKQSKASLEHGVGF